MTACFIDTMRPITPAETEGWKLFLSLSRDYWKAARIAFRRVHTGTSTREALQAFVSDTGITDAAFLAELEAVLTRLTAG